ncbi:MAG: hypothetical protein LC798_21035 [Chloroflexi bacterium]|nr:hypothetical protein [Chloroflexota bacterium]
MRWPRRASTDDGRSGLWEANRRADDARLERRLLRLRVEATNERCQYCGCLRWAHQAVCPAFHRNGERRR